MSTAIASRRQELAARILKIEQDRVLDMLEETLVRLEMKERVEESVKAAERGEVIALEDFHRENVQWLLKNATK